eukprot:620844-Pyramimonas_sp.AAC.1
MARLPATFAFVSSSSDVNGGRPVPPVAEGAHVRAHHARYSFKRQPSLLFNFFRRIAESVHRPDGLSVAQGQLGSMYFSKVAPVAFSVQELGVCSSVINSTIHHTTHHHSIVISAN